MTLLSSLSRHLVRWAARNLEILITCAAVKKWKHIIAQQLSKTKDLPVLLLYCCPVITKLPFWAIFPESMPWKEKKTRHYLFVKCPWPCTCFKILLPSLVVLDIIATVPPCSKLQTDMTDRSHSQWECLDNWTLKYLERDAGGFRREKLCETTPSFMSSWSPGASTMPQGPFDSQNDIQCTYLCIECVYLFFYWTHPCVQVFHSGSPHSGQAHFLCSNALYVLFSPKMLSAKHFTI